jgi:N-acetyl-alpha-D-muramate 1-phosphate uridylyltransferase
MSLPVAILAGGVATRLGSLAKGTPKALIEVAGRPFAAHQLELLKKNGIEKVVFCVGHLGDRIEAVLGDGSDFGLKAIYTFDGPQLLGTGGALRQALPLLGRSFFVLYGDSYLDCDYAKIEAHFAASGKLGLMTLFHNRDRWDRSNVVFREGVISRYDKTRSTADMEYIDYGLGILRAEAVQVYPAGTRLDLETVYQALIARGLLAGFVATRRFYEIGSLQGLEETRRHLARNHD